VRKDQGDKNKLKRLNFKCFQKLIVSVRRTRREEVSERERKFRVSIFLIQLDDLVHIVSRERERAKEREFKEKRGPVSPSAAQRPNVFTKLPKHTSKMI
jgi:hypothetical protein